MADHQIPVERPWAKIPTKQLVNTETGQTEVFVLDPLSFDKKVAESGADNKWKITDENELLKRYNNKNPTKQLPDTKELEKEFNNSGVKQFNNDRADVINKNSPENTKTFLATKVNPVPGVTDPKTGITAGQTAPTTANSGDFTQDGLNALDELAGGKGKYKGRGREDYPKNLKYPEKMDQNQDRIQFQVIEYVAKGLGLTNATQNISLRTNSRNTKSLATITLPMPSGGISDRNSVDWQSDTLDLLASTVAGPLKSFLDSGSGAAGAMAKQDIDTLMGSDGKTGLLKDLIKAKTLESALGSNNILGRLSGLAVNPNLELLFNGPQLREFSFSFKMTPRSKGEAEIVRTFKQAMSVKRSASVLLLKSPHTFRISYKTSNKDHPYLNRFKECALTNCSVNYTPDGSYMSYDDSDPNGRSMTAYELTLSFSELEPIFDDDYDKDFDGKDEGKDFTNIGY
jgi:hypothetical protein